MYQRHIISNTAGRIVCNDEQQGYLVVVYTLPAMLHTEKYSVHVYTVIHITTMEV